MSFSIDAFSAIGDFALDFALVNTKKRQSKKEYSVVSHAVDDRRYVGCTLR